MAGTSTASPATQISFRGTSKHELGKVRVTGSRSGEHTGHLAAHSDGRGASFLLDNRLAAGETVAVRAGQPLAGAGSDGAVVFTTAKPAPGFSSAAPDAGGSPDQSEHFKSAPGLLPPRIRVLAHPGTTASGDIFTAPKIAKGQDGALITDEHGDVVWFHPAPSGTSIYDFRRQSYRGRPVLTWWEGRAAYGKGIGQGVIYDDRYREVARVRAGNGYSSDLHELQLTPQGTALITTFALIHRDLRSVHGPKNGVAFDSAIQEIDVKTGLVELEWHGLDHIPLSESIARYRKHGKSPYDPLHFNSIDVEPNGDLLISARHTNAVYELARSGRKIRWRLGGTRSSFDMRPGASFVAQHDARRQSDGAITLFDNGAGLREHGSRPARGVVLRVNTRTHRAKLLHSLVRTQPVQSVSQGNVQGLPGGHYFVGWGGASPFMSEFDHDGKLVFDASFSPPVNDTYRAFRFPWHATPSYPPAVAAALANGATDVWASWNGATEVAHWQILAGPAPNAVVPVGEVARDGFETHASVPGLFPFVAARALGKDGGVLGTSPVIATASGGSPAG